MTDALEEEVRGMAVRAVAEGFEDEQTIVRNIVETLDGDDPTTLRALAARLTAAALAAHLAEEATWPAVTDCDRLDRAFAALEASGIVARQNFTCCQNCGHAEIRDELTPDTNGYVFYHVQDTESAADGHGLLLAYGATRAGVEPTDVGRQVVSALEQEGMAVRWDGTVNKRIFVSVDWKRRRTLR
jgi:hypothetical protein